MSPNRQSRWATWGTVSSGFREIGIGWNRLGSVGLLAPFLAPAAPSPRLRGGLCRRQLLPSGHAPLAEPAAYRAGSFHRGSLILVGIPD
jgi:hypothetical protein